MQWVALRAQMPVLYHHHQRCSPTPTPRARGSTAGRFAVWSELPTSQDIAGFLSDSPLLPSLLRITDGVRLYSIPNSRHRSVPCVAPLCAVNPRSRKEWLLLHNLPHSIGKGVHNRKEEEEAKQWVRDDAVAVESLETKTELTESTAEKREYPTPESVSKIRSNNLDVPRETRDVKNQKFRPGNSTERRQSRVENPEKTTTGRELWQNGTYQPQAPNVLHGNETRQFVGNRQKKESSSVPPTETGLGPWVAPQNLCTLEEIEETHTGEDFTKKGPVMESPRHQPQELADLQTRSLEKSVQKKQRGPSLLYNETGGFGVNSNEGNQATEATSQETREGLQPHGRASLYQQGSESETGKVEEDSYEKYEDVPGLLSENQKLVDYNGEKVVEVWRKGKVVKRYKPLGIEFLYGRTKPTRLYGPLNSRGEVPGSDLAPVSKRYRARCEHDKGWNTKEVVAKLLELNHWDDIDRILNKWVGRFNRKNFPPLLLVHYVQKGCSSPIDGRYLIHVKEYGPYHEDERLKEERQLSNHCQLKGEAMTRTGALKHSLRLFSWMKNQRCYRARTDIYNLMIWLYARHYRVDAARALFKEMQEWRCKPDVQTFNALINVHGRARQWPESLRYYDRMLRAKVPPSTDTYNNLISACGNSGQWKKGLALYEQMKIDGVLVDVVTHNTVLTALKTGERYSKAIKHFEQILEWKVLPDTITLNIIISCFSKMEKYDEAVQLFNSMTSLKWDGCRPNLVTFTTIMHVYAVSGQVENVKAVFDMMVREGVVPNLVSYNTLIGAYASLGMDVEALEVFEDMQKVGFEPDIVSYTALMNAYSKSGKPEDAAHVFKLMKKVSRKPNVVTYNTLIGAYSAAGQVTKALGLLPDMDFDEVSPNVVTICSLVVGCGRSGEIGRISSILEVAALRRISLNVNVYNTCLSVYLNHGMFEEANKVYATLKEEGIAPDLVTFSVLINGAAKVGNAFQAQMYFDEMLSLGIGINVEACSALIHAYAKQGRPEDAHAVLTRMKESNCAPDVLTYTSLIHAYIRAEIPEAALTVYEEMEALGVELDAVACSALFTVFNQCGQAEKTIFLWSKWREHIQFGTAAFIQLSKACSMLTDWKMALELLDSMRQVGVNPNSAIGNNLLRSLTKGGDIAQVPKILDRFKADGLEPDLKMYKMVLTSLEKVQMWDTYIEVYDQMMTSGCPLDLDLSRIMVNILREREEEERAQELESVIRDFKQENERDQSEGVSALSLQC